MSGQKIFDQPTRHEDAVAIASAPPAVECLDLLLLGQEVPRGTEFRTVCAVYAVLVVGGDRSAKARLVGSAKLTGAVEHRLC